MCGDYYAGCVEGAMKEHPKYESTKPLVLDVPEKITIADLMFVEDNLGVKKPLFVHTDVCMKFVTGVVMSSKEKADCMDAIIAVKDD